MSSIVTKLERFAMVRSLCVLLAVMGANTAPAQEVGVEVGGLPYRLFNAGSSAEDDGSGPLPSATATQRDDVAIVQSSDSQRPIRLIVELREQALIPYAAQSRAQAGDKGSVGAAARITADKADKAAQVQAINERRRAIDDSQSRLIAQLRRDGRITAEHRRLRELLNAVVVSAPAAELDAIRSGPDVKAVYLDAEVHAALDASVGVIGAPTVWSMLDGDGNAVTGRGVTIAIIDTGIDYSHPDLGGCFGPECKVIGGFDFVNGDEDPLDDNGHGTHVAGIAAANGGVRGVAPDAHLLAYKVLDSSGFGLDSDVIAGIERAVDPDGDPLTDDAADVINMSLGSGEASTGPLALAANRAMDAGVVVVAAAGNSGSYRSVGSPGVAERIVTVGAADNNGQIAGFSSRGPVEDRDFAKPEIVAPGVNIRSTWPGGDYHVLSGTSMATPHVAGAAALQRQLHPTLDSQEIKALLVNNARDLGLDVFTQGTGMLDVGAAATAQVVVTPAIPSFGAVDTEQPHWQAQLPVTLRNISTQDWAATVQSAEVPPVGVEVAFSQTEGLAVESGQSATFDLGAVVDNQLLSLPDPPTLHHESALSLASASGNLRLPWLLFKAARLDLVVHGTPSHVFVSSGDCGPDGGSGSPCWTPMLETNCLVWDAQNPTMRSVRVSPGKYHVIAAYADPAEKQCAFLGFPSILFKDVAVESSATLVLDRADVKHRVHIGEIVDRSGRSIPHQRLSFSTKTFDVFHTEDQLSFLIAVFGTVMVDDTFFRISDVPDGYRMTVDSATIDLDSPFLHREYFVLGDSLAGGVRGDIALGLDASAVDGVTFSYADTHELSGGVDYHPAAGLISLQKPSGIFFKYIDAPLQGPHFSPFKVTAYAAPLQGRPGERAPELIVSRAQQPGDPGLPLDLIDTNPVSILKIGEYVKFDGRLIYNKGSLDLSHINFMESGDKLSIANGVAYLSSRYRFNPINNQFTPVSSWDCLGYCPHTFSDLRHNLVVETVDHKIFCDDALVVEETVRSITQRSLDQHCDRLLATFSFPTRIFGHGATSSAEIELFSDRGPEIETPVLHELMLASDGRVTRVLDGDDLRVRIKASIGFVERGATGPLSVTIEYRLDDAEAWVPLDVTLADEAYHATLPALDGAHIGSLRIQLRDPSGNNMTQTLNALFLLGRDARLLTDAIPTFPGLRDLLVPATGPLTAFDIPSVMAIDPLDGAIPARTDSKGPFTPGRHSIRWTAVNSADVAATAIQRLTVADNAAPTVAPPPDIVRRATGLFTPVDLGEAFALDQVDGELTAVPNRPGPFGVGTHVVIWTARDRAGNIGRATQTIVIEGDVPPVEAISSAMESDAEDIALAALPALPDARFAGSPLVVPTVVSAMKREDNTPPSPYDSLTDGVAWMPVTVPATPDDEAREYALLAVAEAPTAQELHLYVGEDGNGNGPEAAEQRCARRSAADVQVCELRFDRDAGAPESTYWVLAHNVRGGSGNADAITLRAAVVPLVPENRALTVTGPGHAEAGRPFTYRVAWDDPDWLPGEERVGYVLVYSTPGELVHYEPLWLRREGSLSAAHMLTPGVPRSLSLAPGQAQDRIYVDIPDNATAVSFRSSGSGDIELYAAHDPDPSAPGITPAPARDLAQYKSQSTGADHTIALEGSQVLPGRWYLTPVNRGADIARISLSAVIEAQAARPPVRPGHFYNPARSGHGMFLDFAGEQWAMVWYSYLEDGTPTWYLAQNLAPGPEQSQWSSPLYRVTWNGSATHLTVVGNLNLTILPGPFEASPKLTMSFNLDGDSGWEPLTQLGDDSCPGFGGVPLDATGHWYSPERSGFGYNALFQTNVEAFVAYVYDSFGYPRWLIGQKDFDAGDSIVPLLQLSGFCPLCQARPPASMLAGMLMRLLSSTSNNDGRPGLTHVEVEASLVPPLDGEWRQSLPVFMLTDRHGCK